MRVLTIFLATALSVALAAYHFVPEVQQKFSTWPFRRSPVAEVQDALRSRSKEVLKASAIHREQIARLKQNEADMTQVQNSKRDNLSQIQFLTSKLKKGSHRDAVLTIHNVSLQRKDVERDLAKLVFATEELAQREEMLEELIARLLETTNQAASDLANARGDMLAAENWLNEKKADLALAEVRRWSGSFEDPLVRISLGDDELKKAQQKLEQQMIENGIDSTSPTESGRPWKRWSDGHATSAEEIQSRAQQLLAGESDRPHGSHLTSMPVED